MSKHQMKKELDWRLYQAQVRWFKLKEEGHSKHSLKMKGIREKRDMHYFLRPILFTGSTRMAYSAELKRFIDFAHDERGRTSNSSITAKDFKAYMEKLIHEGKAIGTLSKVRSAVVKLGSLCGKTDSFVAMSRKVGDLIRDLRNAGKIRPPSRPRVTAKVRDLVIERLRRLDSRHDNRGYHLVLRLQKEAALRVVEATDRFRRDCLMGIQGGQGRIQVVGKGGRVRILTISEGLYRDLENHFRASSAESLARRDAYRSAYYRAVLYVGGRSTGTHAQRRVSAQEHKDAQYWKELKAGRTSKEASNTAKQAAVDRLGHSSMRQDIAKAYLR